MTRVGEMLYKKGEQEGLQEGLQEAQVTFVKKRLANGEPVEKIARYTGLTEQEILELKK